MKAALALALAVALAGCSFAIHDRPGKKAPLAPVSRHCESRLVPYIDIGLAVALGGAGTFFAYDNAQDETDRVMGEVGPLSSGEATMTFAGLSFFAAVLYAASAGTAWKWGNKCRGEAAAPESVSPE